LVLETANTLQKRIIMYARLICVTHLTADTTPTAQHYKTDLQHHAVNQ